MVANIDEAHQDEKNERAALRLQGYRDVKSKIHFRKCKLCGGVITHDGDLCHNCQRGIQDPYTRRMYQLQKLMCPNCKKVVTGGVTCRRCATIIGRLRRGRMKVNPSNWELLHEHIHATKRPKDMPIYPEMEGRVEKAAPIPFDTSPYKLDNRMVKLSPQLTVPTLRVRSSKPFRGRSLNPPTPQVRRI